MIYGPAATSCQRGQRQVTFAWTEYPRNLSAGVWSPACGSRRVCISARNGAPWRRRWEGMRLLPSRQFSTSASSCLGRKEAEYRHHNTLKGIQDLRLARLLGSSTCTKPLDLERASAGLQLHREDLRSRTELRGAFERTTDAGLSHETSCERGSCCFETVVEALLD